MRRSFKRLSNKSLLQAFAVLITNNRQATADLLACMAEIDARKLYLPAGFPSMYAYCVRVWGFLEDSALKRIRAARAAARFPEILDCIADGRLHLSAVVLLAPHLTDETAQELIVAASRKTKAAVELLVAQRYPRPDMPTFLRPIAPQATPSCQVAPGPVAAVGTEVARGQLKRHRPRLGWSRGQLRRRRTCFRWPRGQLSRIL